jgi:hypothetical protein
MSKRKIEKVSGELTDLLNTILVEGELKEKVMAQVKVLKREALATIEDLEDDVDFERSNTEQEVNTAVKEAKEETEEEFGIAKDTLYGEMKLYILRRLSKNMTLDQLESIEHHAKQVLFNETKLQYKD